MKPTGNFDNLNASPLNRKPVIGLRGRTINHGGHEGTENKEGPSWELGDLVQQGKLGLRSVVNSAARREAAAACDHS